MSFFFPSPNKISLKKIYKIKFVEHFSFDFNDPAVFPVGSVT